MGITDSVDLNPNHLATVKDILAEHVPECEVRAFGSRTTWTARDYSDLDLAVVGERPVDWRTLSRLKEAFEESNLPMRVDVLDWHAISESFREVIERDYVVVQEGAKQTREGEWQEVTLAGLIDIKHGFAFKGLSIHDEPQGDVLLTPGNFAIGGGFKGDKFKYYDGSVPEGFVLHEGDLLVTMTDLSKQSDTLGYPALVPANAEGRRYLHNQRLGKILPKGDGEICTKYIYYVMCSAEYRHEVLASATGTTVKHTSPDRIKQYRLSLPPLTEQRAIAHVLGTLDDKIELNRRMNDTLEGMARALFKSWFVDFEPVRAKMEGRWRRGESLPGLPAEHYDLFPDRLVESELGEIPEGWEVKPLGECIDVERGLSYKGSGLSSRGAPMHNLNSIYKGGGYKDDGIKYYNGDYRPRHVAHPEDVMVANTDLGHDRLLIGFAAIVPKRFGEDGLFSHHLYRVRPKSSVALTTDYTCQLLNTAAMHGIVSGYATGTTVNMLPADALRIPLIVVPPIQLVTTFSAIAEAARMRQGKSISDFQLLAAQRDALLPRLVSGEMGVGETLHQRYTEQ